jgi:hypothetical protein
LVVGWRLLEIHLIRGEKNILYLSIWIYFRFFFNFFNRKVRKVKNLWICGEKNLLYLSIWIYFRFFFNFFNRKVRKGFRKLRKVKNLWICGKKNVLYLSIWIYFRFYFNLDLSTTINFPNINYPLTHSRFGTLSFGKGRG